MSNPAQEGINAARRDAYERRTQRATRATLAAYEDARETGHDAADSIVAAMKAAIAAGATVDEAAEFATTARENDDERRADEAAEELTQRVIEATAMAYEAARDDGADDAGRIIAAMKAAIAAGAAPEEAGQLAQIAHADDTDRNATPPEIDGPSDTYVTEAAITAYWQASETGSSADSAGAEAYTAAREAGATEQQAWEATRAAAEHYATGRPEAPAADEAEQIAREALRDATLTMRADDTATAERALAIYARQVAYQRESMTETQSSELRRLAQELQQAREAQKATRRSFGLSA